MDVSRITRRAASYPEGLALLREAAPDAIELLGQTSLLHLPKLALFCSVRCPASLIAQAHEVAVRLANQSYVVAGGFQSPVEREAFALLARGTVPLLVGVARRLEGMPVAKPWRRPLSQGRLLALSPIRGASPPDASAAWFRNRVMAALSDIVLMLHASPGGKSAALCQEVKRWNKKVLALDHPANAYLSVDGVTLDTPTGLVERLAEAMAGR